MFIPFYVDFYPTYSNKVDVQTALHTAALEQFEHELHRREAALNKKVSAVWLAFKMYYAMLYSAGICVVISFASVVLHFFLRMNGRIRSKIWQWPGARRS